MRQIIEHQRESRLPPATVYALLADANSWPDWSPIKRVTIEREADQFGIGEIRRFQTGPITTREEVIVSEEPHSFSYRMLSGVPVRDYRADISIVPTATGSLITWHSEFKPRIPGSGTINRLIISQFVGLMLKNLAGAS